MLFKTYQKITTLFKQHHGYMSFSDLRDHQVTVLQLAEMEEEGSLERFARGWYWCKECGYEKPKDYQYIEIAKVNPRAVICMDSAAWLAGMLEKEPETIFRDPGRSNAHHICDTGIFCLGGRCRGSAGIWRQ